MKNICGSRRVIGEKSLPVHAWEINNSKEPFPDEILIKVDHIHLENCSFNQICVETSGDERLIKETVLNIARRRGKLHNPFTNTAGLIAGKVEQIGADCKNPYNLNVGDEVLVSVSASMIPLVLDCVNSVDYAFGNLSVSGYTVIYDDCPIIKKQPDISWELMMLAFEESASIYNVSRLAKEQNNVLIIVSNPVIGLLYSRAVRSELALGGKVVGLFYKNELFELFGSLELETKELMDSTFDEIHFLDVSKAIDCYETITCNGNRLFDITVNCADQMGAESVSVMATRENGTVFFSSLDNNYNIALFTQEAINREMKLQCAAGYNDGYTEYMTDFLYTCRDAAEKTAAVLNRIYSERGRKKSRRHRDPGMRQTIEELMTYKSPKMEALISEIEKAALYDCSVVI